ncbi:DH domain-containing protein [Fusarium sp. LHS14.1]|nr:DH domain-containing protein [Fusarium sp. LHS14.1]
MASIDPPNSPSGITPNIDSSQQPSWPTTGLPVLSRDESPWEELGKAFNIDPSPDNIRSDDKDASDDLNKLSTQNILKDKATDSQTIRCSAPPDYDHLFVNPAPKLPFRKWVRSLKRRNSLSEGGETYTGDDTCKYPEPNNPLRRVIHRRFRHRFSSSGSSLGFITAVQSAGTSLITASVAATSRRRHGRSRAERSSRASLSTPRVSKDVGPLERAEEDLTATQRAFERRQILEELISTEENYIGDIRFLMNTYVNMLAALPSLSKQLRSSTNRNLHRILQLHDEILGDLHRVVPFSEYSQLEHPVLSKSGRNRSRGLNTLPECGVNLQALHCVPGMLTDPQVAAEVAKVFSKKTHEFFIYKEYGAKFEMMRRDIAAAHVGFPEWEVHQKGVEALGFSVGSPKGQEGGSNKALTVNDLLIKPIQRICRYPLLFAELLKHTPVLDCPNSHMEVETALARLREATVEINNSATNEDMKTTLEKTWLLQDRLVFPDRRLDADSKNQIRAFGHIQLCGALHVCWEAEAGVEGQYMICLLYKDVLCLASGGKSDRIYTILACIDLHSAKVEDVDKGGGLRCHLAPFSWKLVFEGQHELYELVMTACSPKEENEWRSRLQRNRDLEQSEKPPVLYNFLTFDMKSLGAIFRRPGTMARSASVNRATTAIPYSAQVHVILKNTSVVNIVEAKDPSTSTTPK